MKFVTSKGRVAGRTEDKCVRISRLRYAKPPIGALRFSMPQPIDNWDGILDATGPSVAAPQLSSRLASVMGNYAFEQSEDCLHLDIWIPKSAKKPLPVVVYFHGGAFMTGSGAMECYNGGELAARQQVVVVNVNYRLGVLGFLPIPGIAPANLGLHDQILALQFIRDEIAAFGGDETNITAVGQSAGAFSLSIFLCAEGLPRLFDKAVLMSGPFGMPAWSMEAASKKADILSAEIGCSLDDTAAWKKVPVADLLKGQLAVLKDHLAQKDSDTFLPLPFMPVIDGTLLKSSPGDALESGKGKWCPLVIGTTREEYAAFWFDKPELEGFATKVLSERFEAAFPGMGAQQVEAFRLRRPSNSDLALLGDLHTATLFFEPSLRAAAGHAAAGGSSFVYSFDWQSPNARIAACHCIELPFFFGNLNTWAEAPMIVGAPADELARLRHDFQSAIGAFARTGNPGSESVHWDSYKQSSFIKHFGRAANDLQGSGSGKLHA